MKPLKCVNKNGNINTIFKHVNINLSCKSTKSFIIMIVIESNIEDINCSDWAKDSIREAILRGIVPEKLQNDYSRSITREEFCDLVMKLYIQMYDYFKSEKAEIVYEKVLKSKPFVDCNSENVALAEYLGIVKGVGNDEFYPDKSISRQEAAVMLYNLTDCLFEFTNNKIEPRTIAFDDEDEFSEWAKESIYFVCGEREFGSESLMWGTGDNKFMPLSDFTVEQAISTMYRIINTLYKNNYIINVTPQMQAFVL